MIFICCFSTDITAAFTGNARTAQLGVVWGAGRGGAWGRGGCEDSFTPLEEAAVSAGAST